MDILEPTVEYKIYVKRSCPYCIASLKLLEEKNIKADIVYLGEPSYMSIQEFKTKFGQNATVPRVYKNQKFLGGSVELRNDIISS